jgi:hypothetical protein
VGRGVVTCRPTLMRTPVVKRQTSPESGFWAFFRRRGPGVVILWQRVLTWFLSAGTARIGLHHTLLEGLPPSRWRLQRAVVRFSAPEKHLWTLRPSYAKEGCISLCASEAQARVRGSPQQPSGTSALGTGARADVQAHAQGQGKGPRCSSAFGDAKRCTIAEHGCQAEPIVTQ